MKKILCMLLALLALALPLTACQKGNYIDDKAATEIGKTISAKLGGNQTYTQADSGALDDFFQTPDYVSEAAIYFSDEGNNIDEFGIFHVKDGQAKEMADLLEKYLTDSHEQNAAWYDSYIPEETPKLRDAEVKTFGNYVLYAILSEENKTAAWNAAEELLAK